MENDDSFLHSRQCSGCFEYFCIRNLACWLDSIRLKLQRRKQLKYMALHLNVDVGSESCFELGCYVVHDNCCAYNCCRMCSYWFCHEHYYCFCQQVQRRLCSPIPYQVVGNIDSCNTHNHYRLPHSLFLYKERLVRLGISNQHLLGQRNTALILYMFWLVEPPNQNLRYVQSARYSLRKL
jgi:hypothetical protein